MNIEEAIGMLNGMGIDKKMTDIYVDKSKIPYEKERYVKQSTNIGHTLMVMRLNCSVHREEVR